MRKQNRSYILVFLFGILLLSCTQFYGIHPQKFVDKKKISSFYQENRYSNVDTGFLDKEYISYIKRAYRDNRREINNHIQPMQAIYFNGKDQMLSYFVNCNAGGFPNLNWDRDNNFAQFPPITQTPIDNILSLDSIFRYTTGIPDRGSERKFDYTIVVFWDLFAERQSKRLIDLVVQNAQMNETFSKRIILINNDSLFLEKD